MMSWSIYGRWLRGIYLNIIGWKKVMHERRRGWNILFKEVAKEGSEVEIIGHCIGVTWSKSEVDLNGENLLVNKKELAKAFSWFRGVWRLLFERESYKIDVCEYSYLKRDLE